jgi:hypothetical protein
MAKSPCGSLEEREHSAGRGAIVAERSRDRHCVPRAIPRCASPTGHGAARPSGAAPDHPWEELAQRQWTATRWRRCGMIGCLWRPCGRGRRAGEATQRPSFGSARSSSSPRYPSGPAWRVGGEAAVLSLLFAATAPYRIPARAADQGVPRTASPTCSTAIDPLVDLRCSDGGESETWRLPKDHDCETALTFPRERRHWSRHCGTISC